MREGVSVSETYRVSASRGAHGSGIGWITSKGSNIAFNPFHGHDLIFQSQVKFLCLLSTR